MKYEQEAATIRGMREKINNLEAIIVDMNSDFEKCAHGISPCLFCANDEFCMNPEEHGCHFIWKKHN